MNQLTRWNPFKALARGESNGGIDQLLRDFSLRPFLGQLEVPDIRIDISETDKSYTIKADIPGVKKDDIDVAVEGRHVSITARSSSKTEKKDETSLYTERSEGHVSRSFTLPADVDEKDAEAKYENGVLKLTLRKKGNGNNHRVKIS